MKVKTNDIEAIRQINSIMVLDALRRTDHLLSRPNVADILGLSKVTISNIIKELNDKGLTTDAGVGTPDSRGGRKPLLVDLDRNTKRVLGVRMGQSIIELVLSDITGQEIKRLKAEPQEQDLHYLLVAMVKDMLISTNTSKDAILGMVVAANKTDSTISGDKKNLSFSEMEETFKSSLGIPVWFVDFTLARAFAESWFSSSSERASFFYVNLEESLDCAMVRLGLLNSLSCEFGACYMTAIPYGQSGHCITVDSVLSARALQDKASEICGRPIACQELNALANENSAKIKDLFQEYGYCLGCALSLVVNMAGLRKIILGGSISNILPHFEKAMWQGINNHVSEKSKNSIQVRTIEPRFSNGLAGAMALALDKWIFQTELLYGALPVEG